MGRSQQATRLAESDSGPVRLPVESMTVVLKGYADQVGGRQGWF
jgi:hypothetical protein